MIEKVPRSAMIGGALLAVAALFMIAYERPGFFAGWTILGGLVFVEFLFAAIWLYRRVFFIVILMAFLFAGTNLPVGSGWTIGRWVFLAVGALVGCVIVLLDRGIRFGIFHVFACFAVLMALVSAAVSRYPSFAILKAASLLLLFVYAATGARLAVIRRENQFFTGLLMGCELYVPAMAISYSFGREVMGNPNSLGAVLGVVCAPVLLWGILLPETHLVHHRRILMFVICAALIFYSHSRAGMAAAVVSCALLCFCLRRFQLLVQGAGVLVILLASVAILAPETFSNSLTAVSASVIYKGQDPTRGLLASRESPWQSAVDIIREHTWFGTGFGTTDNGQDASARLNKFTTQSGVTAENGSSYLALTTWVGVLGVVPFLLLLAMLARGIGRTIAWMWRTGSPAHPAVPLMLVVSAGLLHAGFEDWLFAPGYYLCVFFWSLAFVLVDLAPTAPLPAVLAWRPARVEQGLDRAASGQ